MTFSLLRTATVCAVIVTAMAWPGLRADGDGPHASPSVAEAGAPYDFTLVTARINSAVTSIPLNGASMIVVKDGQELYKQHFGTFNDTTGAFIASSSKWYSAAAFMTLVDDGLVSLDDPVSMYLPDWTGQNGTATLRQLWSHTSGTGFTHACLSDGTLTVAQCVDQIRDTPLLAPPGAQFYYGQVGMQVGARIAEVVSGQSWDQFFADRIETPLEMTATAWWPSATNPQAGGGAFSTLHDYNNFMSMLANGGLFNGTQVLEPATVAEMQADQVFGAFNAASPTGHTRYGLGEWRDVVGSGGEALEVSSSGAFGFMPWLDLPGGYYGVFMVQSSASLVASTQQNLRQLVRDIIGGDGDGCIDAEELGSDPLLGGMRDPAFRWDFYDVNGTQKVDAADIGLVRGHFKPFGPVAPQDMIYDRSQGVASWAPGAPDGKINALDIGLVRASFNHTCAAAP
jgi:CubicO group peptidase (beta-lactamase class C family)